MEINENLSEGKKKRLANLRPFKTRPLGAGRKLGSVSIITKIKHLLAENNGAEAIELSKSLIKNAKRGNPTAITQIMNRIDGVIVEKQEIDISGNLMAAVAAQLSGGKKAPDDPNS